MVKKLLLLFAAAAVLLVAGGCDFEFGSIESLMRPPLTQTERKLDESIRSLLGSSISLRSPESGNNHSAITLHDLDGDGKNEAIVFYANEEMSSVVRMSVLKSTKSGWAIVSDFAGSGSGVYSLDFYDLNNDGCDDMLVSWYLFEDKVNKTLTVYSCSRSENEVTFSACATEPYNLLHVEDIFGTGEKQILLAYTDLTKDSGKTHIRLMQLSTDNLVVQLCKKKLDDRIIKLSSIQTDKPENMSDSRVFIDAEISDSKKLTEVLVWNENTSNFSYLVSNLEGDGATVRSSSLSVQDIDGDGLLEIPLRETLPQSSASDVSVGYMLVWNGISGSKLTAEEYYIVNLQGNYRMYFPKYYIGRVFVCSDNSTGHWSFVNASGTELFNIAIYDVDKWEEYSDTVTAMLFENSNKVYACNITKAGESFGIESADLIKYFSMNT